MKTTAYQIAVFATLSIAALGSQAQSKNTRRIQARSATRDRD